jgi:hypothetical protein
MSDHRKSKPRAEPAGADRRHPLPLNSQARMIARTSLTIAIVGLALWVGGDFLPSFGWAAILAITMWPVYSRCFLGRADLRSLLHCFSRCSRA